MAVETRKTGTGYAKKKMPAIRRAAGGPVSAATSRLTPLPGDTAGMPPPSLHKKRQERRGRGLTSRGSGKSRFACDHTIRPTDSRSIYDEQ